jgi:isocitrate/isopropylmalate dehydrogenase
LVLEEKKVRTKDIGGFSTTTDFTKAIIHRL